MPDFLDLTRILLDRFPELRSPYEEQKAWMGEELDRLAHVTYGNYLTPYIVSLLESPETAGKRAKLKEIFDFLEELANDPNLRVQEVVEQSVLEYLTDKEEWLTEVWPYMGPTCRQFTKEAAELWGTSRNFPFS